MVNRQNLRMDSSLFEGKRSRRVGDGGLEAPRSGGARSDNALVVAGVLALVALILIIVTRKNYDLWPCLAVCGPLLFASEYFALSMKSGGRLSISLVPIVVSVIVGGPLCGVLVTLFALPVFYFEGEADGWRRIAFNAAQYFVSAGFAGWVYWNLSGKVPLTDELKDLGGTVLPLLLAILIFFLLNTVFCASMIAPAGEKIAAFWKRRALKKAPGYLLYGIIGFLSAIICVKYDYPAFVIVFIPLIAIRVVYTRYGTMRDVCDDTTLAVIDAIEGRGMFYEGHSTGVADMATAIAEEMGFAEGDIHFIRQAALLHDVGKLAIDPALFEIEKTLTADQYEEIKRHPLVAASIVSKEPSFEVVAPSIRHHHEMADGAGYPDGLKGETIPVGARVLHLADSYDAMLHPASYRGAMSEQDAASEIVACKGIEYDPVVVDAFVKVVTRRGLWKGAINGGSPAAGEQAGHAEEGADAAEPDQPTLMDAILVSEEERKTEAPTGATPGEGIKYGEVRNEIEKDIREWERSDIGRSGRKPGKRTRKEKERPEPEE